MHRLLRLYEVDEHYNSRTLDSLAEDVFQLRTSRSQLRPLLGQIVDLANSERSSLGFIPIAAFNEAIERGRLIALVDANAGGVVLVGYLLFSGVKTSAKIQQIATHPDFRRRGIGQALMRALIDVLEKNQYLSIQADVADDLQHALDFYKANEFEIVSQRPGGETRKRTILIHARFLDTPSLFDTDEPGSTEPVWTLPKAADLSARTFALDVVVYIDLVRDRGFKQEAEKLFKSALSHEIRVAVADEFCAELRKSGSDLSADPLYQLALQLPNLPPAPEADVSQLADQIYSAVFVDSRVKGFGKESSKRDARHLAHAALSGADAFVTRDRSLLNASRTLLSNFNIDVMSPEELVSYLPIELSQKVSDVRGAEFSLDLVELEEARAYFERAKLDVSSFNLLRDHNPGNTHSICRQIKVAGTTKACAIVLTPRHTSPVAQAWVHVKPEAMDGTIYAEALVSDILRKTSENAVSAIRVFDFPGQSIVKATLRNLGFIKTNRSNCYEKIVAGRAILPDMWSETVSETRRRSQLKLPDELPSFDHSWRGEVEGPNGRRATFSFHQLEGLLDPVLIVARDRPAVIVPIRREYSQMLLGEGKQLRLGLGDLKSAQFRSLRAYIGSAMRANLFAKGGLLFFYESSKDMGTGGIVAVARIVDSIVTSEISSEDRKRVVIDDLDEITSSDRVLTTRFDNVFHLSVPVMFHTLKRMGVPDGTNFVTATSVSPELAIQILKEGGF